VTAKSTLLSTKLTGW